MNEQKENGWWKKEFHERYSMKERGILVVGKDIGHGGHAMFHSESIEAFISQVELDARKDERERVLGEMFVSWDFSNDGCCVLVGRLKDGGMEFLQKSTKDSGRLDLKGLSDNKK